MRIPRVVEFVVHAFELVVHASNTVRNATTGLTSITVTP